MKRKFNWKIATVIIVAIVVVAGFGIVFRKEVKDFVFHTKAVSTKQATGNALEKEFEAIQSSTATFSAIELKDAKAILVKREWPNTAAKVYELWLIRTTYKGPARDFIKSFSAADCENIIFKKDGDNVALSIEDACGSPDYQGLNYYVYDTEGREVFAYEHDAHMSDAMMRSSYEYDKDSISVDASPCEETSPGKFTSVIKGLKIGDVVRPLPPSRVECRAPDMGPGFYDFSFTFGEYDSTFNILTLILSNGQSVMIDVGTKTIVHSKTMYNEPCYGSGSDPLILTTPNGTTVLFENVWSDPVLHSAAGDNPAVCLSKTPARDEVRPTFSLDINFGEGSDHVGTYEFNLKTHKFKKLK